MIRIACVFMSTLFTCTLCEYERTGSSWILVVYSTRSLVSLVSIVSLVPPLLAVDHLIPYPSEPSRSLVDDTSTPSNTPDPVRLRLFVEISFLLLILNSPPAQCGKVQPPKAQPSQQAQPISYLTTRRLNFISFSFSFSFFDTHCSCPIIAPFPLCVSPPGPGSIVLPEERSLALSSDLRG